MLNQGAEVVPTLAQGKQCPPTRQASALDGLSKEPDSIPVALADLADRRNFQRYHKSTTNVGSTQTTAHLPLGLSQASLYALENTRQAGNGFQQSEPQYLR